MHDCALGRMRRGPSAPRVEHTDITDIIYYMGVDLRPSGLQD